MGKFETKIPLPCIIFSSNNIEDAMDIMNMAGVYYRCSKGRYNAIDEASFIALEKDYRLIKDLGILNGQQSILHLKLVSEKLIIAAYLEYLYEEHTEYIGKWSKVSPEEAEKSDGYTYYAGNYYIIKEE